MDLNTHAVSMIRNVYMCVCYVQTASLADTEVSVHTCLLDCTSASCAHYRCCPLPTAGDQSSHNGEALKVSSMPVCPTVKPSFAAYAATNGTSSSNPELTSHKPPVQDDCKSGAVLRPNDTVVSISPHKSASTAVGL